jgi:hypothetical protein
VFNTAQRLLQTLSLVFEHRRSLEAGDFARSVLTSETIAEIGSSAMKTVTVFDNLFPLPHPIPLDRLQSLGCGAQPA